MGFLDRLFGVDRRALHRIERKAKPVFSYEEEYHKLKDSDLRGKTVEFKKRLANGETLDDILPEAFATAREAAKRTIGQFPYPVQVFGSTVLHDGNIAEMKTGEGKTLTATMAVYLNALDGKGTHVVTVNEYLAGRDADWMGQIYRFLGLTVGVNNHDKNTAQKKEAYDCDITYTTNSELGFDYLRDNMATSAANRVLRRTGLHFAIVDEADSILIDESRTPLIISGGSGITASSYEAADRAVKSLKEGVDFTIDIKKKIATLTDAGINKVSSEFGIANLFEPKYADLVHRLQQALKANFIMSRGTEYMVVDGEILLIDSFTGRVMKGREYSDGLQQALQAKEHVEIKPETVTMATITYQNFFRLYDKLAGMTGTAKTEEEEFRKIYNMLVIPIKTNRPIQRFDDVDSVFGSEEAKYKALIADVIDRHKHGQPVLIGTLSVEKSEIVDRMLNDANIPHQVLNAKNHAREAAIVAQAGQLGAVTVATNMAGRGTDIKLGRGVKEICSGKEEEEHHYNGLAVIGTERNESRRVDNQLRGRAGRQGDPGYSKFYVSVQDDLLKRFSSTSMENYYKKLGADYIESKILTRAITSAQKKVEGQNFDTRKSLLDYDDILRQQREIMYAKRDKILFSDSITDTIPDYFKLAAHAFISQCLTKVDQETVIDGQKLKMLLEARDIPKGKFNPTPFQGLTQEEGEEYLTSLLIGLYNKNKESWTKQMEDYAEKLVAMQCIDKSWTRHIDTMAKLRNAIWLRSYANTDPLQAYTNEGYALFDKMQETIADDITYRLLNIRFRTRPEDTRKNVDNNEAAAAAQRASKEREEAAKKIAEKLSSESQVQAKKLHLSSKPAIAPVQANAQEIKSTINSFHPTARDVQVEASFLLNKGYASTKVIYGLIKLLDYGYLGKQELSLLTLGQIDGFTDADSILLKNRLQKPDTPSIGTKSFASRKEFDDLLKNQIGTIKE